ncbi:MAG: molecular chaperone HtpG, partial [Lachnospiraceae bacterium]|nr:molecular chaperone HtpG [Lachnospiraceae bacterium]
YELPMDYKSRIDVVVDSKAKTIAFHDNGLGMTAEEVDEYINQIAFSGAADFVEKYKDKTNDDQIIGHFGLGFYSAFMVADEVHIDSLSYKPGAKAVHWECDGGTEFDMEDGDKTEVGTTVTLFLNEDCLEYCNEYKAREVLKKYCSFMPIEIYLSKKDDESTQTIKPSEKLESDVVVETIAPEKEGDEEKLKIKRRPELLNDTNPLWTRNANDCTREEYLEFYRTVFHDYKEPLFWIHLNMDYPFNLKGILYFPKINTEYDSIEGTIKLYNNQVFVADNIKEVIPEFLMLLKGVIDCPDLPLNVSRSALQNDGFVKKISDFITKKVADKLAGMCKTDKESYEKYWDDISPFIKYGCLKDDKFCEKMTDYILFKNLDGHYMTLPECLEVKPIDVDEDEEAAGKSENAVDENGNAVEAEVVDETPAGETATDENGNSVEAEVVTDTPDDETESEETQEVTDAEEDSEEESEEESKNKTIYYVTDERQQAQYIRLFQGAKMDAVILDQNIDQPFISQLENKNEGIHFQRIDADLTESLKAKTSKKVQKELTEKTEIISKLMKKTIKKENLTVKLEKLRNSKVAALITVPEESRRMQDMMKMYAANGMSMGDLGKEDETLVLNAANPLVKFVLDNEDNANAKTICEQLYDLAKLQHAPLEGDEMARFISRSNEIMMLLTKQKDA